MVKSSQDKKKNFYLVVLVLTFIAMLIGTTLAYFSLIASQKEEGTVLYTGTLEINYIDGVYIKNPKLLPTKNVTYATTKNVYRNNFAVSSSGTLDQNIRINLDVATNQFAENAIKYAIYNSNKDLLSQGTVPKTGSIELASNLYLKNNDTATYTLIVWLDNTNYNQNFEMGKTITGRISVYATQIKY